MVLFLKTNGNVEKRLAIYISSKIQYIQNEQGRISFTFKKLL